MSQLCLLFIAGGGRRWLGARGVGTIQLITADRSHDCGLKLEAGITLDVDIRDGVQTLSTGEECCCRKCCCLPGSGSGSAVSQGGSTVLIPVSLV